MCVCVDCHPCRYVVYADGYATSTKLERYLLLGSTVLKQDSPYTAYFHDALVDYVHHVPFWRHNATDILQVSNYAF